MSDRHEAIYQDDAVRLPWIDALIDEGLGYTEMRVARLYLDALTAAGYHVVAEGLPLVNVLNADGACLMEAAKIIERRAATFRSEVDRCSCGHERRDHYRGIGCVNHYCWYDLDSQCKRFSRDRTDLLGPRRRALVDLLREAANEAAHPL